MKNRLQSAQSGVALIVGLVFLVVMTLVALISFKLARSSLDVVGNMQATNAVVSSANAAIEEALSTVRMFQSPNAVFLVPCVGANTRCYDVNSDGTNDITVTLTPAPTCVRWNNILNRELDPKDPQDTACATGTQQSFGVEGAPTGNSLCADSVWEINAVAEDAVTSARVTVTEGASVRVSVDDVLTACP